MAISGFIIHEDNFDDLMDLSEQERGEVLTHLIAHYRKENLEESGNTAVKILARVMKRRIDYDLEKYEKKALAGSKGGSVSSKNKQTVSKNKQTASKDKQTVSKNKQTQADGKQDASKSNLYININTNTNTNIKDISKRYSEDPELDDAIHRFVEHRKKLRKPMTEYAIERLISKLNTLSTDKAEQIAIIQQSIDNCWQGVFELKQGYTQKTSGRDDFLKMIQGGAD